MPHRLPPADVGRAFHRGCGSRIEGIVGIHRLRGTWDDVPATTIESCGNYRDHSLFTAKEWCKDILAKGISSDPFERRLV